MVKLPTFDELCQNEFDAIEVDVDLCRERFGCGYLQSTREPSEAWGQRSWDTFYICECTNGMECPRAIASAEQLLKDSKEEEA